MNNLGNLEIAGISFLVGVTLFAVVVAFGRLTRKE